MEKETRTKAFKKSRAIIKISMLTNYLKIGTIYKNTFTSKKQTD